MRIATRCTSIEQFIAVFHRFCGDDSFFVSTLNGRPVGVETAFTIDLADGTPVLRGFCVVMDSWPTPENPFKRPGVRLGSLRLTAEGAVNFLRLKAARQLAEARPQIPPLPPPPPPPVPRATTGDAIPEPVSVTPPAMPRVPIEVPAPTTIEPGEQTERAVSTETRVPGSDLVLPANPLMNISDHQLEGFVDCTLYEETGSHFRAAGEDDVTDPPIDPPLLVPRRASTQTIDPMFARRDGTPLPSPPPVEVMQPQPRRRLVERVVDRALDVRNRHPRWVLGGAAGVLLLVVIITVAWTSGGSRKRAEAAKSPPSPQALAVAPPAAGSSDPDVETDDGDVTKPTGAPPVVGSGPCRLTVATTPAGSIIQVDDQTIGPSPLTIAGPCDRRKVDISHARYQRETRLVTLAADKPQSLDVTLVRPTHTVMVTTAPVGATISIEGRRAGTSPTAVQVMGFTPVTLKIEKPGYQPVTKRLYSKQPQDQLSIKLVAK